MILFSKRYKLVNAAASYNVMLIQHIPVNRKFTLGNNSCNINSIIFLIAIRVAMAHVVQG